MISFSLQMASPQLIWIPRLPNEESPLLINKSRSGPQAPPPLPRISSLPIAQDPKAPLPLGLNFLRPLPPYGSYFPVQTSRIPPRVTEISVDPVWSAETDRNGPFKAIFGANFTPQTKTTEPPQEVPLPLPLHHQSSITVPPIVPSTKKQRSTRYTTKNNNIQVDNNNNNNNNNYYKKDAGGGNAAPPPEFNSSARPAHRRRKQPQVQSTNADLLRTEPSTTSSEDPEARRQPCDRGAHRQGRIRKKVRWGGGA
jgi:hypothetical protein